ncbi:hypothetical protein [Novosphingobium sp. M1R2S20]|uniref:Uncharacterized protein n=1 Tax=Novosphingobium rhizovicinum TaxID=3228928 RepID=A0ABV3RAR2_9SPHN
MSAEEKILHKMLIDARDRTYAHSDGDHSDITGSIWRSDLGEGRTSILSMEGGELLLFDQGQVQAIHTFPWKVRHHVDKAVQHYPAPRDALPILTIDASSAGRAGDIGSGSLVSPNSAVAAYPVPWDRL